MRSPSRPIDRDDLRCKSNSLASDVLQAPKRYAALPEDVARRILVADYRVPRPDVSAGERATIGIASGHDLCFGL